MRFRSALLENSEDRLERLRHQDVHLNEKLPTRDSLRVLQPLQSSRLQTFQHLIHIAATLNCEHARMRTAPTRWIFDQIHSRKPLPTESGYVPNQKTPYAHCEVLMSQYLAMFRDPGGKRRAWGR